jgi:hypothetical protein
MPCLHLICDRYKGLRFDLHGQEVSIGRSDSNAIVIDDPTVSICHCAFVRDGNGFLVRDCGSTNGVVVNGIAVREANLKHGDILSIGRVELVYSTDACPNDRNEPMNTHPPYVPTPPAITWKDRVFWPFTAEGRARRCLAQAYRNAGFAKITERVAKALVRLTGKKQRLTSRGNSLHSDLLVYLVWEMLRRGEPSKAAEYLALLDSGFPDLHARTALRWDLMQDLSARGNSESYACQAAMFMADPNAATTAYADAVLEAICLVYEQSGPEVCAQIIDAAHRGIKDQVSVKAARALCACPRFMDKVADSRKWMSQIKPADLSFSRRMAADANLVAACAAEAAGEWRATLDSALRALRLAPNHRPVLYWLTRAKLHDAASAPTDHLGDQAFPRGQEWDRLTLLVALHRTPRIASAAATMPMLKDKMGQIAQPELLLLLELVQRALEAAPASTIEEIETADHLCRVVEERAGALPWAQVAIAHKKIRLDREHQTAYELLEGRGVIEHPRARLLARIARILSGDPNHPTDSRTDEALNVIEMAMYRAIGPVTSPSAPGTMALFQGLQACRQDPVFEQFPDLNTVVDVLLLALRTTSGDKSALADGLPSCTAADKMPPWCAWLISRIRLLVGIQPGGAMALPAVSGPAMPAVAWAVGGWVRNLPVPCLDLVPDGEANKALLKHVDGRKAGNADGLMATVLAARATGYHTFQGDAGSDSIDSVYPELGKLADGACAAEIRLELRYACARRAIAQGMAAEAVAELAALNEDVDQERELLAIWWRPLVSYWLGVAQAHQGDDEAASVLESLLDGPRSDAARGQLTLIALRDGRLEDAARWLDGASSLVPGVLYARALLLARRGESAEARQAMESDEARRVFHDSAYVVPARRLAAAIEERAGNREESDHICGMILAENSGDEVAGVRLGRSLLESGYAQFRERQAMDASGIGHLLRNHVPNLTTTIPWWPSYALLYDLMSAPDNSLSGLGKTVNSLMGRADRSFAFRQTLAVRLVRTGQPAEALRILAAARRHNVPPWLQRTRSILNVWQGLSSLSHGHPPGSPQAVVQEHARTFFADNGVSWDHKIWLKFLGNIRKVVSEKTLSDAEVGKLLEAEAEEERQRRGAGSPAPIPFADLVKNLVECGRDLEPLAVNDPTARHWQIMAGIGAHLAGGAVSQVSNERWRDLAPHPMAHIPLLFDSDPEPRQAAAESLAPFLDGHGIGWTEDRKRLLRALIAWPLGDDDSYMEEHASLEPILSDLPVAGPDLWLSAARIRFDREDWKTLLEGDMPDCVADMSHPHVRLLVALGYARAAADDHKRGNVRAALQKARQAAENLEALVGAKQD